MEPTGSSKFFLELLTELLQESAILFFWH